jgi:hypothetical protein
LLLKLKAKEVPDLSLGLLFIDRDNFRFVVWKNATVLSYVTEISGMSVTPRR